MVAGLATACAIMEQMAADDRILDELLTLTGSVAELGGKIDSVQERLREQGLSLIALRDTTAKMDRSVERLAEETHELEVRVQRTEQALQTHRTWRSRLSGLWVGATAAIAMIASLVALLTTFWKGR